jgi:DNA replication and repair protein RecF
MALSRLEVRHVRNLTQVELSPASHLNIIYGANASGKTSLLEAIYILGHGRSFRTNNIAKVIQSDSEALTVFGQVDTTPIGIEKSRTQTRIRIAGQWVNNSSHLAQLLPLQIITPDSHRLIEQGPKYRRQFLDWGVFHVEHQFVQHWRRYQRALKQRNAILRSGQVNPVQIQAWDKELIDAAQPIQQMRLSYLDLLLPLAQQFVNELLDIEDIRFSYLNGWKQDEDYGDYLRQNLGGDIQQGYTRFGPHRADLAIRVNGVLANERVSRGQQKLLSVALRLAQVALLQQRQIETTVLVDDLPAELDQERRQRFMGKLQTLNCQTFITATELELFLPIQGWHDKKMFHVEHGRVKEVVQ